MEEGHYHSIRFAAGRCNGCMSCMRACPTQAIRIRRQRAVMLDDRCIDCGECIKVCTQGAVEALTETLSELRKFDYTVAIPSPALYTQFDGDAPPRLIHKALRESGFDAAATLSWSCAAVTRSIELFLSEYRGQYPLISSFCPTVVRLLQVKYPGLLDQLLPVISPREVAAREAKRRTSADTGVAPDRIGAVYVTPCPAKMVSIVDHPGLTRSFIDSAVSIRDLYPVLASAIRLGRSDGPTPPETETAIGLSWAFSIGLPSSLSAEDTMSVAGLPNVIRLLDDIEEGKLRRYAFIEVHACPEGCVSGALTVENPYVARARAIRLRQSLARREPIDDDQIGERWKAGDFRASEPFTARPLHPLDKEISGAITKMKERDRLVAGLPGIDCGACGAPRCSAFAEDVVRGEVDEGQCVFVRERRIEGVVRQLSAFFTPPARKRKPPREDAS
jgi:Na+-translocating ferredoxin:NAD+ oxidoreductase RNF subunit RnfB